MSSSSYAVVWQDDVLPGRGPLYAGKLELQERRLRLEGRSREGLPTVRTLDYGELGPVRMAPASQRIGGRPTLVVERADGLPLRLGTFDGRGLLTELAEQLSQRILGLVRRQREAV